MSENFRIQVFAGLILVVIAGLIFTNVIGNKQDEEYITDYQTYQMGMAYLQENNVEKAERMLSSLAEKYPNQYILSRYTGLAYAIKGNYSAAEPYFQRAIDQRPFLQVDPMFLMQFGEAAYNNGKHEKAKAYLLESKKYATKEYYQKIDLLLSEIESKKKSISKDEE